MAVIEQILYKNDILRRKLLSNHAANKNVGSRAPFQVKTSFVCDTAPLEHTPVSEIIPALSAFHRPFKHLLSFHFPRPHQTFLTTYIATIRGMCRLLYTVCLRD